MNDGHAHPNAISIADRYKNREGHSLWLLLEVVSRYHLTDHWPLRLRKLKERKKPPFPPVGVLGPSSPRSCANSVPGRSIRRVMLLSTSSRKISGFSWRSFSTKKSGLKMTGGRPAREPPGDSSWLITMLHSVPLRRRDSKIVNTVSHSMGEQDKWAYQQQLNNGTKKGFVAGLYWYRDISSTFCVWRNIEMD